MKELIKKILKENFINEAAGISYEVREWAKTLKKRIQELIDEKDGLTPNETVEPHFEDLDGGEYEIATYPGNKMVPWLRDDETDEGLIDYLNNNTFIIDVVTNTITTLNGDRIPDDYEELMYDVIGDIMESNYPFYDIKTGNELFFIEKDLMLNLNQIKSYHNNPINELVINGHDYPELYNKFSVDKWVFKNANRIEYDHWNSGYDKETGEYVVYFNVPIRGLSIDMFIHEIKHAYDDWNRMSNKGKPIRDSKEVKNIYTKDFEKLLLNDITKFNQLGFIIRLYYLGSKLETPAYLENEFDSPKLATYRNVALRLIKFNLNQYFNNKNEPAKGLEDEFVDLLINYDIPLFRKFKNVKDFLVYTKKYFNRRGRDILKRIDKSQYINK